MTVRKMEYRRYGSISASCFGSEEELVPLYATQRSEYKGNRILGMTASSYYFSIYIFMYLMFLCSGAALFSYLEAPEETGVKLRVAGAIQKFLVAHPTVTG